MLEAVGLKKTFHSGIFRRKSIIAVDNVSFSIKKGESLGLIGESGSGKTTIGKLITRLIDPTGGQVYINGQDILKLKLPYLKKFRQRVQMIFQEPDSALDPRWKIAKSMAEPFKLHRLAQETEIDKRVRELISIVGLHPEHLNRYPFELSGGQLQRISLARVLALEPEIIVADEPTSSLDVSVQAQVLSLLKELQKKYKLTLLFISHDLNVARRMCDRVAVMYRGTVVEEGSTGTVFEKARHPYTRSLLDAILIPDPDVRRTMSNRGFYLPDGTPVEDYKGNNGCTFWHRCLIKDPLCMYRRPDLVQLNKMHRVACHKADLYPVLRESGCNLI
ncbi:MAG: oligopeptide/dipeptide ABC transporter ATP-binding protein [Bacillota bacterium]